MASPDRPDRKGEMTISVVIPHLNQPEALARCLASLMEGRRLPEEVVVVDNGSEALPQGICNAHRNVALLEETLPGPGPARNRGIKAARGGVLAFIDADCRAHPDWLATIERVFTTDAAAHILGGDVRIARREPGQWTMLEAYESIYAYRMDRYIARQGFTGTGNLAMRREAFAKVGPFGGLGVAEDRDWGQRATALGYRIEYVPEMMVFHPARTDFAELASKWDRHTAHDFAACTPRKFGRLRWGAKTSAMAVSPLAELPRLLLSDRVSGVRARRLAGLGLVRIRLYRARRMFQMLRDGNRESFTQKWNR